MSRLPRIDLPGFPQHVIVREHNRSDVFRDESDRWVFLRYLEKALAAWDCELHSYVLMSNHVHLLATCRESGAISSVMQSLGRFARYMNARRSRSGALYERRFRSSLVESETYLLTCMRYIELNPVRAGIVSTPLEYPWSSFRSNASGSPDGVLTPHAEYLRLGTDDRRRSAAYLSLFEQAVSLQDLEAIRETAAQDRVLGSADFRNRLERQLGRPVGVTPHGGPRSTK